MASTVTCVATCTHKLGPQQPLEQRPRIRITLTFYAYPSLSRFKMIRRTERNRESERCSSSYHMVAEYVETCQACYHSRAKSVLWEISPPCWWGLGMGPGRAQQMAAVSGGAKTIQYPICLNRHDGWLERGVNSNASHVAFCNVHGPRAIKSYLCDT